MRTIITDYPHHIVQRGHDKKCIFIRDRDYRYYLNNLFEQADRLRVEIVSYCLMTNHVHLILLPRGPGKTISRLMKVVAARQTRHFNKSYGGSGTLWEGRYKSSVIDTNAYLLACCRYVDLNPVRAYLVADPKDYKWSSYRSLAGYVESPAIDRSAVCQLLDFTSKRFELAYRDYVAQGIDETELQKIRSAIKRNQLTGSSGFVRSIEQVTGRTIESRGPGRPPSPGPENKSDTF